MKRVKFYICPDCQSVLFSTGNAQISCCGRKLSPLTVNQEDPNHTIHMEEIENDYYITMEHEMTKDHFISFVAFVTYDRVMMVKLYPEQTPQVRIPRMSKGSLYVYCSRHGLIGGRRH